MAQIVLGLGSSHTPMLNTEAADWEKFVERDARGDFLDKQGRPATYAELLERADPSVSNLISREAMIARFEQSQRGMKKIERAIADAKLDALIVVGDDQKELFHEDNLPSLLIYYGQTIRNVPRHLQKPNKLEWFQRARAGYYEAEGAREFPVRADLAAHMIASLIEQDVDVSSSDRLPDGEGEGHAFAFIHKRLMAESITPIVPVCLNTYYPPNQPTPKRCYQIGKAIRAAVESFRIDLRVGVIASGGLSHFVVDEDLDLGLLDALERKDAAALTSIDRAKLNSGSSEIRNWICAAGAVEHLKMQWRDYMPCYRTPAGTGTGVAFAIWS
jgi:3-O-methylgallate 3,4-dioxygenase